MTNQRRSRLMFGTLIVNSVLLGLLVWLVSVSVAVLCSLVDQDFLGGMGAPPITDLVMAFHSRHLVTITSLASAVTASGLFMSFYFFAGADRPSGASLCISALLGMCLVLACYFIFCLIALTTAKIPLIKDMGASMENRLRYSHLHHLPPPLISSTVWGIAASVYSVGLFVVAISIRRNSISKGNPTRTDAISDESQKA